MEEELSKKVINDDILHIVKGFIDYFEKANQSAEAEEKDEES